MHNHLIKPSKFLYWKNLLLLIEHFIKKIHLISTLKKKLTSNQLTNANYDSIDTIIINILQNSIKTSHDEAKIDQTAKSSVEKFFSNLENSQNRIVDIKSNLKDIKQEIESIKNDFV
jgi:hypothetical protein